MESDNSRRRRKLLVASIGVATVSYAVLAACDRQGPPTTGNLPAPPPPTEAASPPPVTGNLPAPPPLEDAALPSPQDAAPPPDAGADAGRRRIPPTTGNLPAPPRRDAGRDPW